MHSKIYVLTERKQQQAREAVFGHTGTSSDSFCYSYTKETARDFLNMDFYFGIGGVLTFNNAKKLKEAVEYIPMDRIVLETDCPYLAPVPYRGKRNCSLYIAHVIEVMAQIKGISEEEVRKKAWDNAHALYRL